MLVAKGRREHASTSAALPPSRRGVGRAESFGLWAGLPGGAAPPGGAAGVWPATGPSSGFHQEEPASEGRPRRSPRPSLSTAGPAAV
jgi:hypothetical protein